MSIDVMEFRNVMAHWATGVTVVTAFTEERPVGITASSLTSLSLDPPQILISVARKLYTHAAISSNGVFAVNILRADQVEWGKRFAGLLPEFADRFAGIEWTTAQTGCAILPNVLGWMDCRVRHAYDGNDHTIFVGEVVAAAFQDGDPLLYFSRGWRVIGDVIRDA